MNQPGEELLDTAETPESEQTQEGIGETCFRFSSDQGTQCLKRYS